MSTCVYVCMWCLSFSLFHPVSLVVSLLAEATGEIWECCSNCMSNQKDDIRISFSYFS